MTAFAPTTFQPHPLFVNEHAQTILAATTPRRLPDERAWRQAGTERIVTLPDGDQLSAILHRHPDDPERRRPLLVLFHGLEGAIDSPYVVGMSLKAYRLGYHSIRVNFRNCGGTEHLAEQLYTSMLTGDLDAVIREMAAEGWPRLVPVGVSMSANMLLNLLADYGDAPPAGVIGAVAISPPIEQGQVNRALSEGFNRVYDAFFLNRLRRKMARRAALRPNNPAVAEAAAIAARVRNLREFDDAITAPALGLTDALAYYRAASSAERLGQVRVKTLLIHAQDDPFLPYAMFEAQAEAIAANPALVTEYPAHGGHVGFMAAPWVRQAEPWMDEYWAENEALRWVRWLDEGR